MENKILEQIKKSETAMLDTLAQIVNIDSGYDALEGIDISKHRMRLHMYLLNVRVRARKKLC